MLKTAMLEHISKIPSPIDQVRPEERTLYITAFLALFDLYKIQSLHTPIKSYSRFGIISNCGPGELQRQQKIFKKKSLRPSAQRSGTGSYKKKPTVQPEITHWGLGNYIGLVFSQHHRYLSIKSVSHRKSKTREFFVNKIQTL